MGVISENISPAANEHSASRSAVPTVFPDIRGLISSLSGVEDKAALQAEAEEKVGLGFLLLNEMNVAEVFREVNEQTYGNTGMLLQEAYVFPYTEIDSKGITHQGMKSFTQLSFTTDIGEDHGSKLYGLAGVSIFDNRHVGVRYFRTTYNPRKSAEVRSSLYDAACSTPFAALRDVRFEDGRLKLLAAIKHKFFQDDEAIEALHEESREELDKLLYPVDGTIFQA